MQFQGKSIIQTQENGKKNCHFGPHLGPFDPNSSHKIFFSQNLAASFTRYHDQVSSCKISEKTDDPILGKFRQTER